MLFGEVGDANNFKRIVYLCASTLLGFLVSFVVYALVEFSQIKSGYMSTETFMGLSTQEDVLFLGSLIGFFVGRVWWRKIYIEKVWTRKKKNI